MVAEFRILIIEDDLVLRTALSQFLGVHYKVDTACSLGAAREAIQNETFGVILLDKTLPDGFGPSILPIIAARSSETAVIIITGDDDLLAVSRAIAEGADDYVIKTETMIRDLLVRIPIAIRHARARAFIDRSRRLSFYRMPMTEADIAPSAHQSMIVQFERDYFTNALRAVRGNTFKLAAKLAISRSTLFRKFGELEISVRHVNGSLDGFADHPTLTNATTHQSCLGLT
jgi:DNA-binding NtrC family response regulator